jgi:hypothetical protein
MGSLRSVDIAGDALSNDASASDHAFLGDHAVLGDHAFLGDHAIAGDDAVTDDSSFLWVCPRGGDLSLDKLTAYLTAGWNVVLHC